MSYKDGIPLLSTFDDDPEDDGYGITSEVERRKCKCARGHMCFGVVLVFAMVLVIALAVSITLGFTLKSKSGGDHPEATGHDTGYTTTDTGYTTIDTGYTTIDTGSGSEDMSSVAPPPGMSSVAPPPGMSSVAPPPGMSSKAMSISEVASSSVSVSSQNLSSDLGQVSSTGVPSLVPTMSTGTSVLLSASVAPSSGVMQPSLSTSAGPLSPSAAPPVSSTIVSSSTLPISSTLPPPISSASSPVSSATLSISPAVTSTLPQATPTITSAPPVQSSAVPTPSVSSAVATPTPTPTPPPPSCVDDSMVCPSPQDNRTYSFTTLPSNNLRVLLISDPSTDLSGASMNVAAGSFNDPANYTGLAHFCEHMLFLGTEKYPDKNEYSNYLSTHGGYDNAYTDSQETNYFFRVQAGYLDHALDLFAQFFIGPLFNEVYVGKELNAVNQEHQKNLLSDDWKLWQLLKHISNPEHPFHQFSTGDFKTLNKSDIREQLLQYYHARYSASTMNLVVYGRENMSTLLDLVTRSFSNISNTNAQPLTYTAKPFVPPYAGRTIIYEPQASTNTLSLVWEAPSLQDYPRSAVGDFIIRYLGHEGEGSIFKYLQRHNFASELMANVEVAADSFYLFMLQITLTEEGLANVSEVIRTVFEYVDVFKSMTEEEFNDKWEDFVRVSQVAFDYKERESPSDYVKDISKTMRVNSNPADFLPNPSRYTSVFYLVYNTLRRFTPLNSLILIGTKNVNVSSNLSSQEDFFTVPEVNVSPGVITVPLPELNLVEPIYSTPFTIYTTPGQLSSYWTSASNNSELYLASPNVFVPDEATLIPVPPSDMKIPVEVSNGETWMLSDTATFFEPKVNLRCELRAGKAMKTPQWAAKAKVYLGMVNNKLGSIIYSAKEVGYTLSLKLNPRGVELELGGLSDDSIIQSLINITIKTLINEDDVLRDSVIFDLVVSDIRNTLQNFNYTNLPFRYTYQYIQSVLLERPTWTNEILLQQLDSLTMSSVLQFGNTSLMSDLDKVCFVHGSTSIDSTASYISTMEQILSNRVGSPSTATTGYPTTRVLLNAGQEYGLALPTFNPADSNSVVNLLFQAGEVCHSEETGGSCSQDSLLRGVYLSLLNLVISDACFTQLRTIEGLGYVVFCFTRVHENIGSFQAIIQSEEFGPGHVLNSTNSFLTKFLNDTIMSAEFEEHFPDTLDVLRLSLSQRDLTLSDKTDRLWLEIMSGDLHFNLKQQQVSALDGLMVEDFQDFYSELIVEEDHRKKLTVVVYGEGKEIKLDVDCDILYDQIVQTGTELKTSCS